MDVTGELHAQDALLTRETAPSTHWYEAGWAPQPVQTYLGEEKISLTCWKWYHISSVAQTIGDHYKDYVILTPSLYAPRVISIFGYDKAELVLLLVGFHVQIKL